MHVVGYTNIDSPFVQNYVQSLTQCGYDYTIVGRGDTWVSFVQSKIQTVYDYICTLDDSEIVAVTDVFDLLFVKGPDYLSAKFRERGCDLIFGMEALVMPGISGEPLKPFVHLQKCANKYVNGGFYMGYVWALKEFYADILASGYTDDQLACCKFLNKTYKTSLRDPFQYMLCTNTGRPIKIGFDVFSHFVGNMPNLYAYKFKYSFATRTVIDTRFGTEPAVIHFPGGYSTLMVYYNYFGSRVLKTFTRVSWSDRIRLFRIKTSPKILTALSALTLCIVIALYKTCTHVIAHNHVPFLIYALATALLIGIYSYLMSNGDFTSRAMHDVANDDPMNRILFQIADFQFNGWSLSHVLFYILAGFLFPQSINFMMVVWIAWEVYEKIMGQITLLNSLPMEIVVRKDSVYETFWDGRASDIAMNAIGTSVGFLLYKYSTSSL